MSTNDSALSFTVCNASFSPSVTLSSSNKVSILSINDWIASLSVDLTVSLSYPLTESVTSTISCSIASIMSTKSSALSFTVCNASFSVSVTLSSSNNESILSIND